MNRFMKEAIKEAYKAEKNGDVPVGAVIVKDNKIISRAYNKKESSQIATKHAELIAIEKACGKLKNWRLNGCTMYVTMEPCLMCFGSILQSRIEKIIYSVENDKFGFQQNIDWNNYANTSNHKVEIESGICEEKCKEIMQNFFKEKRNN